LVCDGICGGETPVFSAKDKESDKKVTSLDPAWRSRFDELRALAASERLVCPGCARPVRFRVGEQRRPHFAHVSLSECPLSRQSAEVLEAKAQLYEWLTGKYPSKVEFDVDMQLPDCDRVMDLLVHPKDDLSFAYWVFDRAPRNRHALLHSLPGHVMRNVVQTQSAHRKGEDDTILLTAAQRDFIGSSKFDPSPQRGHLHFLDTEDGTVTIYRGIHCVHPPSHFGWQVVREEPLMTALISPEDGEITFSGDVADWRQRQQEENVRRAGHAPVTPDVPPRRHPSRPSSSYILNQPLTCEKCGVKTTEWMQATPGKGLCICRGCTR
jgi:hypothetical protein